MNVDHSYVGSRAVLSAADNTSLWASSIWREYSETEVASNRSVEVRFDLAGGQISTGKNKRTYEEATVVVNNGGLDDNIWEGNSDLSVGFIAGD